MRYMATKKCSLPPIFKFIETEITLGAPLLFFEFLLSLSRVSPGWTTSKMLCIGDPLRFCSIKFALPTVRSGGVNETSENACCVAVTTLSSALLTGVHNWAAIAWRFEFAGVVHLSLLPLSLCLLELLSDLLEIPALDFSGFSNNHISFLYFLLLDIGDLSGSSLVDFCGVVSVLSWICSGDLFELPDVTFKILLSLLLSLILGVSALFSLLCEP